MVWTSLYELDNEVADLQDVSYNSASRRRIKQMLINKFSWRLIRRAREPAEIESNSENSIFWFTGQRLSVSQIEQIRTGCYEHMNIFKTSSLLKKDVEKDRFENKFNAATREIPGSSVDQIGNWPLSNQAKLKLIFELAFAESLSLSPCPSAWRVDRESIEKVNPRVNKQLNS